MVLSGKYGSAIVYNDYVEETAVSQIINLLNQPMSKDANVRIMSDVHAGAGCVIGYTAYLTDKVVPNLIGVDIGCGVLAIKLKERPNLDELENLISKNVPTGFSKRESISNLVSTRIKEDLKAFCSKIGQNYDTALYSLGTLGGGNHFMELNEDSNGDVWFVVHTGSRNLGKCTADYFQEIAKNDDKSKTIEELKKTYSGIELGEKIKNIPNKTKGLEYLEGKDLEDYLEAMKFAQQYASLNREIIVGLVGERYGVSNVVESVHNFIDLEAGIVRKGAISAQYGEMVIIPLNMKDGSILGIGKGNIDWNFSAPHGAGRKMSRSVAKSSLLVEDFEKQMEGIYSTCVGKSTLDESPMAYKDADEILKYIEPTVEVVDRLVPIWNYKAK